MQMGRPDLFTTKIITLNGVVIAKVRKLVTIGDTGREAIEINLDVVNHFFNPMVGDELSLEAKVANDCTNPQTVGEILNIVSIRAANKRNILGKITKMPAKRSAHGVVEGEFVYMFYENALENAENREKPPDLDDSVVGEAISGRYETGKVRGYDIFWRCIKLYNLEQKDEVVDLFSMTNLARVDELNVNGIWVTPNADLKAKFERLNDRQVLSILVKNISDTVKSVPKVEIRGLENSQIEILNNRCCELQSDEAFVYEMEATAKCFGIAREVIEFEFPGNERIRRIIQIELTPDLPDVQGAQQPHLIERNFSYTQAVMSNRNEVQKGVRAQNAPRFVGRKLDVGHVPERLSKIILSSLTQSEIEEELVEALPSFDRLESRSYRKCFESLLHLEEIQLIHNIRKYDKESWFFVRENEYLSLQMPNVTETRPSLILGMHCTYM